MSDVYRTVQNPAESLQPTREQFEAYRATFAYFNEELFDGNLPEVVLNFSRRARTLGFFAPERWERCDGEARTHEISLNPDTLTSYDPRDVASTLVHEMVHLWQHIEGTPSRRGYHNREWADRMERIGLMPSNTGAPGGRRVGQGMTHYILESGAFSKAFARIPTAYLLPWRSGGRRQEPAGPVTKSLPATSENVANDKDLSKIKYTCPDCSANVWGKQGLQIVCGVCRALFVSAV